MFGMGMQVLEYDCLVMGCYGDVMGWRFLSLGIWLSGDVMGWRCKSLRI